MTKRNTTAPQHPKKANEGNPCISKQQRLLTVRSAYHPYQLQQPPFVKRAPVTLIELKGHWLFQAGFTDHSAVKVRVMKQCLVITVEQQE